MASKTTGQRITATPAVRQALRPLRAALGGLVMSVQSGGCCAGSVPMCFPADEFLTGDGDLLLGHIDGCPFYIDARLYHAWGKATLTLDIAAGEPEGFSLGPGGGQHFVTRPGARTVPSRWARAARHQGRVPGRDHGLSRRKAAQAGRPRLAYTRRRGDGRVRAAACGCPEGLRAREQRPYRTVPVAAEHQP